MKKILFVTTLLVALSLGAAEMTQAQKDAALKVHGELGYVSTSGNTKTDAFNFELKAKKGWERHIVIFRGDAQYATDNKVETKNRYTIELEYNYKTSEDFAVSYLLGYKVDKFSSFRYQFYTGPGIKYRALNTQEHKLIFDAGLLYAIDQYETIWVDKSGTIVSYPYNPDTRYKIEKNSYKDDYTSYRLKGDYAWQILKALKFTQELSFRGSAEKTSRYFLYSKTALYNKISDIFSAGISYKIDYTNQPAEGKVKTDRIFAFNLVADF